MPKGPVQKEADDAEGDEPVVEKDKHRWDAADLEKVWSAPRDLFCRLVVSWLSFLTTLR